MVWVDLGTCKFFTTSSGGLREYRLEMQDWALQVKDVAVVAEFIGRSSATAQFGVRLEDAGRPELAFARTQGTPIALAAVTGDLPQTVAGVSSGLLLPYFWPIVMCDTTLNSEEYVEARILVGGKQY